MDIKYQYKIKYDIGRDIWNWRGATEDIFRGNKFMDKSNWSNARFIENDEGREIAQKIGCLDKGAAEKVLEPYLKKDMQTRIVS